MTETVNYATGELVEPLTAMEKSALTHAEAAIEQGVAQVGKALGEIRDGRLYRADHPTFEAYCQERWSMTRQHANRKIVAAEVIEILSPMGDTPDEVEPMGSTPTERQARELAPLRDQPQAVRDIWQDVQEQTGGKPTATVVRDTVKRHLAAVPPTPPQDEEFWNDAAEKLTANGWVAKRDAERPYVQTLVRLKRIASEFAELDMNPVLFAENFPTDSDDALPSINALYSWLHTFFTFKES